MAQKQDTKRRRWLTAYAPLVIWIVIIFGLGTQIGAMSETSRIIRPLLEFLFPETSPETLMIVHGHIRKLAHFTEYAVLALLAFRVFKPKYPFLLSLLLVMAVAITDEANQSFMTTRTSSAWDVLLDISGGVVMLVLIWLVKRRMLSIGGERPLKDG